MCSLYLKKGQNSRHSNSIHGWRLGGWVALRSQWKIYKVPGFPDRGYDIYSLEPATFLLCYLGSNLAG